MKTPMKLVFMSLCMFVITSGRPNVLLFIFSFPMVR